MGYRHYMLSIDKSIVDEIKDMSIEELTKRFMPDDEQSHFYHRNLPTETVYELGKYVEFANQIQATGIPLFNCEDTQRTLKQYDMYVVGREGLLKLIEIYKGFIINHYKSLLTNDSEDDFAIEEPKTAEQKQKRHIEDIVREWEKGFAIDLNENTNTITHSLKYEYAIFELTKILKTFDFENKTIIFYGW